MYYSVHADIGFFMIKFLKLVFSPPISSLIDSNICNSMVGEKMLRNPVYFKCYLVIKFTYIFVFFNKEKFKIGQKLVIFEVRM